jgi:hypothetical protein
MRICQFFLPDQGVRLGQVVDGTIYDLSAAGAPFFATMAALLRASVTIGIGTLLREVDLSARRPAPAAAGRWAGGMGRRCDLCLEPGGPGAGGAVEGGLRQGVRG